MRQQLRMTTAQRKKTKSYTEADVDRLVGRYLDTLRKAIRQCGVTQTQISRDTRVPQAVLSRFLNTEERSMKADTLLVLFDYLGFEVRRSPGRVL